MNLDKPIYKLLLIPLIVGVVVIIFQFFLNRIGEEDKELTYQISNGIPVIDSKKVEGLDIQVNDQKTTSIFHYQVVIENTGQLPIKDVPIRIVFETQDTLFTLFNYSIGTIPEYEFGNISAKSDINSIRLTSELLNPGDKIFLNLLTNSKVPLAVFSKTEGMTLRQQVEDDKSDGNTEIIAAIIGSIMSIILAFIAFRKSIVTLSLGGIQISFDLLNKAKNQENLTILYASYGKDAKIYDVTKKLNEQISNNMLTVTAENKIAGDPCPGIAKELKILYSIGKNIKTKIVQEAEQLVIPDE